MSEEDIFNIELSEAEQKVLEHDSKLELALLDYFEGRPDPEWDVFSLLGLILENVDEETCYKAISGVHWQMEALTCK